MRAIAAAILVGLLLLFCGAPSSTPSAREHTSNAAAGGAHSGKR